MINYFLKYYYRSKIRTIQKKYAFYANFTTGFDDVVGLLNKEKEETQPYYNELFKLK